MSCRQLTNVSTLFLRFLGAYIAAIMSWNKYALM